MYSLYYSPEEADLKSVGSVEWHGESFRFNLTAVWQDKSGMYYWASDQGCSCPIPFEGLGLNELNRGSNWDVAAYLNDRMSTLTKESIEYGYKDHIEYSKPQVLNLIKVVMNSVR